MAQQKLKFTIRQDGTVTEEVIGIVGDSCQELTKQIEEALGEVSYKEKKPEYYLCLLYTSPSPRDGLLSRMPSSA